MKTFVHKKDNKYVINGSKMWITNAPIADYFIIWAKYNGDLNGFIVNSSNPGLKVETIKDKMALQSSPTGIIYLDNVIVEEKEKLNVTGFKGPFSCLNKARYGIGWGSMGAARDCLEKTYDYIDYRVQFGRTLNSFQLIQSEMAQMTVYWIKSTGMCSSNGSNDRKSY